MNTTRVLCTLVCVTALAACETNRGAKRDRDAARAELETTKAELEVVKGALLESQGNLGAAQRDAEAKQARLVAAEVARRKAEASLAAAKADDARDDAEIARLTAALATATSERDTARADLEAATAARDALEAKVAVLEAQLNEDASADSDPNPEPDGDPNPDPEPEPSADPDQEPTADPEEDPTSVSGDPNPDPDADPNPDPDTEPTAQPDPGKDQDPGTSPEPLTLRMVGSSRASGTASYSEARVGGRFPGTFSGTRTHYSFNDWGVWAGRGSEVLFNAVIREDTSFFSLSDYELSVTGSKSGSNPVAGSAVWTGDVRAFDAHPSAYGTPVEGDARIEMDFGTVTVDVDFTGFDRGHADMSWDNLPVRSGAFSHSRGYESLDGAFYGDEHHGRRDRGADVYDRVAHPAASCVAGAPDRDEKVARLAAPVCREASFYHYA